MLAFERYILLASVKLHLSCTIPGFLNITPKKPRKDLLADAIQGAAVAFTGVVPKEQTNDLCNEKTSHNHPFALLTFSL